MNGGRRRQFGVYDKEYQFALLRHHLYEALGVVSKVKVFIVHCHETPWLERFKSFAKELGFTHLTLDRREGEDRDWENEHWQTLVEQRVEESSLAWVLHTPDELVTSTRTPNAPPELRTRPNVVFEHGYLFGRYGRVKGRVFVFCCDGAVLPTDMRDLKGIPVRDQLDGSTKQAIRDKLGNWLPVGS